MSRLPIILSLKLSITFLAPLKKFQRHFKQMMNWSLLVPFLSLISEYGITGCWLARSALCELYFTCLHNSISHSHSESLRSGPDAYLSPRYGPRPFSRWVMPLVLRCSYIAKAPSGSWHLREGPKWAPQSSFTSSLDMSSWAWAKMFLQTAPKLQSGSFQS